MLLEPFNPQKHRGGPVAQDGFGLIRDRLRASPSPPRRRGEEKDQGGAKNGVESGSHHIAPPGDWRSQKKARSVLPRAWGLNRQGLGVVADGLDGAAFFGFLASGFLIRRLRLLGNVGVTAVLVPFEVFRCGLAAQVAINALVVNVELARDIFRIFVCSVSHKIYQYLHANMATSAAKGKPIRIFI